MTSPLNRSLVPLAWAWITVAAATPWSTGQTVNDFSLEDLNPRSVRYEQMVSPADYRLQISAYYFGSAG